MHDGNAISEATNTMNEMYRGVEIPRMFAQALPSDLPCGMIRKRKPQDIVVETSKKKGGTFTTANMPDPIKQNTLRFL
jgi:hypothetical protein